MKKAGIKPCWHRQIEVSNATGKHRPLPVGTRGMGCGQVMREKNPLLHNRSGKASVKLPDRYTFDNWCDTPEGVDRGELLLMETWVSSAEARKEAKAVGGGQKVAMRFWLGMLVAGGYIAGAAARHYYQRFMSAMTTSKYPTLGR